MRYSRDPILSSCDFHFLRYVLDTEQHKVLFKLLGLSFLSYFLPTSFFIFFLSDRPLLCDLCASAWKIAAIFLNKLEDLPATDSVLATVHDHQDQLCDFL